MIAELEKTIDYSEIPFKTLYDQYVFEDYTDYLENSQRNVNRVGVSIDFLQKYYGNNIYQFCKESKTNYGCWNCRNCKNCINCVECVECSRCWNCNVCSYCNDCVNTNCCENF